MVSNHGQTHSSSADQEASKNAARAPRAGAPQIAATAFAAKAQGVVAVSLGQPAVIVSSCHQFCLDMIG